jgi:hypothetical protein
VVVTVMPFSPRMRDRKAREEDDTGQRFLIRNPDLAGSSGRRGAVSG